MLSHELTTRISQLFNNLTISPRLLDTKGNCLLPDQLEPCSVPSFLREGETVQADGAFFRQLSTAPPMILWISTKDDVSGDSLLLLDTIITNYICEEKVQGTQENVYRKILLKELTPLQVNELAKEANIPAEQGRSVLVFCTDVKKPSYRMLQDMIPRAAGDVLLPISQGQTLLVKDMQQLDGPDELLQYAQAVQETIAEETGSEAVIGIGDEKKGIASLHRSYLEALKAIEAGYIFYPEEKIFMYRHLLMERFLMSIPKENAQQYYRVLFNENNSKLFTEEMLHTVDCFFAKELNLSDTARALFVHRNTLVYRLDKIQRQTGLDLRHFNDAVIFKILCQLKIAAEEKKKQSV